MSNKFLLSYEDIKQFLIGKKESKMIYQLSERYPAYGIFITIHKLSSPLINYTEKGEFTFNDAEVFLQNYLAGTLSVESATRMLNAVTVSKENFDKLLYKINENSKAIEETSLYIEAYDHQKDSKEIVEDIFRFRNEDITPNQYFFQRKKIVYGLLSAAAVLLILFLSPVQFHNDLEDYYNFDEHVPFDYLNSGMRDLKFSEDTKNNEVTDFINHFNQGMADYLAHDYKGAIKEWNGLSAKVQVLTGNPELKADDIERYYLYSALSNLALAVSNKENVSDEERVNFINNSIALFDHLKINNDYKRYFYALSLALDNQEDKALENLSLINPPSKFYAKRVVLEEQLSH